MTVAELLAASRAAHAHYRELGSPRKQTVQMRANSVTVGGHLWDAYWLRQQAHDADPTHVDLAWADDTVPHEALVAFYREYLGLKPTE